MRICSTIIKIIFMPLIYLLSFYCFIKSAFFSLIEKYVGTPFLFLLAITTVTIFLFFFSALKKYNFDDFLFFLCLLFCFPVIFSFSKMLRIEHIISLELPQTMPLTDAACICVLIFAGFTILRYTSMFKYEYIRLIRKGGDAKEAREVFLKQTAVMLCTTGIATAILLIFISNYENIMQKLVTFAASGQLAPSSLAAAGIVLLAAGLLYYYLAVIDTGSR